MSYLGQNNLLFHNQYGFRSRVSCETQLIQFSQDLFDTLNQGGQTDVIVMDSSRAFDKVDYQRLLLKLNRLGINTTVIAWIKSFLLGRSQNVVFDGEQSGACPVLSDVPQGTVLGPCLFLMYIDYMPDSKAASDFLPTRPSCTLQIQITHTVKPNNQTLPFSNPGRVNGLRPSILRSLKLLGSHKKTVLFDNNLHDITLQLAKKIKISRHPNLR